MAQPVTETGVDSTTPDNVTPAYKQTPREWARANGHSVRETGRLPKAVLDAYNVAHPAGRA